MDSKDYNIQASGVSGFFRACFLFIFFCYIVLKPFYIFTSGLPQPADFLFLLLLGGVILFSENRLDFNLRHTLFLLSLFAFYTLAVNSVWVVFHLEYDALMYSVFYIFNLCLFYVILKLYTAYRHYFISVLMYAVIASVLLQLILSFLPFSNFEGRRSLFFNNPNQLGYYGLLCATIYFICQNAVKTNYYVQIVFIGSVAYLVALSLSKAAMISFLFLILIRFITKPIYLLPAAVILLFSLYFESELGLDKLTDSVTSRLENIGEQSDDSMAGRGYSRIWEYPEYLIFGAGEGGLQRFGASYEIHSTIGTIIFSYGIVGLWLFCLFLYKIYKMVGISQMYYLIPILLYGLTHQGLRFTFLWVLLGLVAVYDNKTIK